MCQRFFLRHRSKEDLKLRPVRRGGSEGGVIRSRQDVTRALERICEYYARTEPSSPLPFLLRRAQRLVDMNFIQIVDELTPEARATLDTIIGLKPDTSGQ